MEKKIIYIHPFEFPSTKANTIQVMQMCSGFSKAGNTILLKGLKRLNVSIKDIRKFYGIGKKIDLSFFPPIKLFDRNISKYIIIFFTIIKYFFIKKKYIIYSRDIKIAHLFTFFGFKNILEIHVGPNKKKEIKRLKKIYKSKNFLKLILISKTLENFYKKIISKKKFLVAPDGVNYDKKVKKKKLFNTNEPKISYVGSFHKGKGIELIIKIANKLKNLNFDIYGGNEKEIELNKKISSKNIFFHGHIPHNKVKNVLVKTDIALMPYQKKVSSVGQKDIAKWMSPLKMFEYMSYKTAIISSEHIVLKEILNSKNSFIVNSFHEDHWVRKIKYILKNKIAAKKKANRAFKDSFKYTWPNRARIILK